LKVENFKAMEQLKLFEVEWQEPLPPPKYANRCRKCIHIYRHQYGKMFYCRLKRGTNTAYGHKKIKANDLACSMFRYH